MNERAYAKINLSLDIVGQTDNGYHKLRMIMQSIGLHDDIEIEKLPYKGIELSVDDARSQCFPWETHDEAAERKAKQAVGSSPARSFIPTDQKNLMYKAAEMMLDHCGLESGVRMRLTKRIPSEAGLAGGSADAAAVIRGINNLYELGLSDETMREIGVRIGADVPYCINGGTALAEGIGDVLTPAARRLYMHVLLIKPKQGMSTPLAYAAYDRLAADKNAHIIYPDTDGVRRAVEEGDAELLSESIGNVLELPVENEVPIISVIKADLIRKGALASCMTGSGTAVYGLFESAEIMHAAALSFADSGYIDQLSDVIETEFM